MTTLHPLPTMCSRSEEASSRDGTLLCCADVRPLMMPRHHFQAGGSKLSGLSGLPASLCCAWIRLPGMWRSWLWQPLHTIIPRSLPDLTEQHASGEPQSARSFACNQLWMVVGSVDLPTVLIAPICVLDELADLDARMMSQAGHTRPLICH